MSVCARVDSSFGPSLFFPIFLFNLATCPRRIIFRFLSSRPRCSKPSALLLLLLLLLLPLFLFLLLLSSSRLLHFSVASLSLRNMESIPLISLKLHKLLAEHLQLFPQTLWFRRIPPSASRALRTLFPHRGRNQKSHKKVLPPFWVRVRPRRPSACARRCHSLSKTDVFIVFSQFVV